MSLIFLAADFPPSKGGIQTVAYELPLALMRAGEEVAVVTVCQDGGEEFDATCAYPVVRVPVGSKLQIATNLAVGVDDLAYELSEKPRAIVATKWFPEGLAATWTLRSLSLPVALIAHGREFRLHGGNPLKWLLQKYILRQVRIAFAVSNWTAGELARAGVRRDRIHVVNNGIRSEVFEQPGDIERLRRELNLGAEPVLLTVGRLVARKGHADIIRLLPAVMRRVGPVTYVIAGSGPEEDSLRECADACGVAEHLRFAGAPSDDELPTYYHLCNVFVMPTRNVPGDPLEGFGIAYLEANAAGKPVIGTRCGGVADAIEDGVSGLLVEPGDDDALVDAVVKLLTDEELAARLGDGGRTRVRDHFTWDQIAARFLEGLASLLSKGSPQEP